MSPYHQIACEYLDRLDSLTYEELADALTYKWFRLNTLYHIKDKDGKKVLFTPNQEQEAFYVEQHTRDIILKARQLGFTTFKMISDLDDCLFTENFSAGCICHSLEDARDIYRNKIRYAYQNITDEQIELIGSVGYELPVPVNDKDNGYVFSNGSSIKVATGYRGGTLQSLHVSEFGKICKKYPEKAKEIVTGAFEAVSVDNYITIESTAEGKEGYFYDYCKEAERIKKLGKELSLLDFKFHFFSWWNRSEYRVKGDISSSLDEYFDNLKHKYGIDLDDNQKAWYSAKWRVLGDDMKREYPTIPEEAFNQSIQGAYYANQFKDIYAQGRIGEMPENNAPVNTAWDLGVSDSTSIWFWQDINGKHHILDYYENSGEGMEHYFKVIKEKGEKYNWKYGTHYAPHDIGHREFGAGAKSRHQIAKAGFIIDGVKVAINFVQLEAKSVAGGIELVRQVLPKCCFDEQRTERGVKCLEAYRKEWNDKLGCYRDNPLHDWASHGADGFRYLAMAVQKPKTVKNINVQF